MLDKALISIIVPVYNGEKYLRDCIESILNQEYKNFELIIINDGSKDNSEKICIEYAQRDNRIKFYTTENHGQSHARNIGLDKSKGEYICFVDSDDIIDQSYLSILYKMLTYANADISVCQYDKVPVNTTYLEILEKVSNVAGRERNNRSHRKEILERNEIKLDFLTNLKERNWGPPCKLYRRELLTDIRYDESFKIEEDLLFNLLVFKAAKKIVYNKERLYFYRTNPESITKRKKYIDYFGAVQLLKKILDSEQANRGKEYYINILTEYIETSLVLADIASNYEKDIKREIFDEIKNNIKKYKNRRNALKQYNKVLYKFFCSSDKIYLLT